MKITLVFTYTSEFYFKSLCFITSVFLSATVLFSKIHTLIFIEIVSFSSLFSQTFLTTLIFEYLNLIWYLILHYLFLSNFFYFMYILISCFRAQLFSYQLNFLFSFFWKISVILFFLFFLFSYFFLPSLLTFLVKWQFLNIVQESVLIELTPLLVPYILGMLKLRSSFFFFLFSFFFFLFSFFFFLFEFKLCCITLRSIFYGIFSLITLLVCTFSVKTQLFALFFIFLLLEFFYLNIVLNTITQISHKYDSSPID